MKKYSIISVLSVGLITLASLQSCYYDIEEELYPNQTACDTSAVSFVNDLVPILQTNCLSCHNQATASGGVVLETHGQVKAAVDNSTLLGVIRHDAGFSPMPQGGNKLLDCEISKFEVWVANGSPNN